MAMKILDQITRVKKRQPDPNVVLASVKNPATELRLLLIVHWADSNHQQLKQVHIYLTTNYVTKCPAFLACPDRPRQSQILDPGLLQ